MSNLVRAFRDGGPLRMPGAFGIPMLGAAIPPLMQAVGMTPPAAIFPNRSAQDRRVDGLGNSIDTATNIGRSAAHLSGSPEVAGIFSLARNLLR